LSQKLGAMPLEVFGYNNKAFENRDDNSRPATLITLTSQYTLHVLSFYVHLQYKFNWTALNYTSGLSSGSKHILSSFHKDHSELPLRTARH
jgi:hypothetical protein